MRKDLVKQIDSANSGEQVTDIATDKTTFAKVAERYEEVRLIPAQYVVDTKIAGLRSLRTSKAYLKRLVDHFGNARIRSITYSQVDEYRLKRLKEDVKIASVNRELALLRAVFNFAKRDGLIARTPFERGTPLISLADEVKRDRVLSHEEEQRLLAACDDPVRAHLKPLIIAAVDTGMRKGEILSLEWRDVDLVNRTISVRAMNTKTLTARVVPITSRLLNTLQSLYNERSDDGTVFGTIKDIKRSWRTACDKAKIKGLRFHDLRATFATRLISAGMPIDLKVTG